MYKIDLNRSHKLEISTAPTKTLIQRRSISMGSRSRESGRQACRQSNGYGGWCL